MHADQKLYLYSIVNCFPRQVEKYAETVMKWHQLSDTLDRFISYSLGSEKLQNYVNGSGNVTITDYRPSPEILFSCSTQLSMKFILLINVKMPTIVGILTIISRINTTSTCLKQKKSLSFSILACKSSKISCSVELSMNMFYNLRANLSHQEERH